MARKGARLGEAGDMPGAAAEKGGARTAPASPATSGETEATPGSLAGFFRQYSSLAPCILGLAFARVGILVSSAGSYINTDEGVFTDGAMTVVFALLLIVAAVLFKTRFVFRKRLINAVAHAAILLEFAAVLVMGVFRATGSCTFASRFTLSALVALSGMIAIAYWLRRARGASMSTAAVLVFSAIFVSEIPVFATVFLPDGMRCLAAAPLVALQLACIVWARRMGNASDLPTPTRADDYFAFMGHGATNRRFLAACAIGIAAVSLVIGFLRGFPDGTPVPFCMPTRLACFLLTEAACVLFVIATLRQRSRAMTVGIWVVMQFLAAFTLVLYTAFPSHLDIGAVTATLLNTLMGAFSYYIVIAFMSSGWRDPFYYAITIWSVWIFSRAIGRFVLLNVMPMGHSHFTGTVISLMLLVATQVVFIKLIDVAEFALSGSTAGDKGERVRDALGDGAAAGEAVRGATDAGGEKVQGRSSAWEGDMHAERPSALERLLGLDNDSAMADVQNAVMRHHAQKMGEQFLLSEREIEVLALYASGMTQKRVAEELHISQTTAHTHIGRIYAKTGLHSRQEILDYFKQYGDA